MDLNVRTDHCSIEIQVSRRCFEMKEEDLLKSWVNSENLILHLVFPAQMDENRASKSCEKTKSKEKEWMVVAVM